MIGRDVGLGSTSHERTDTITSTDASFLCVEEHEMSFQQTDLRGRQVHVQ